MISILINFSLSQPKQDLVTQINIQNYNSSWYSGYLQLPQQGKRFHYVFFPSQNGKKQDPILLWLNGGPGCSSMIGMLYQNGPFIFNRNTSHIHVNNNSWNQIANLLYIESPGGVGFSQGPIISSDQSTAEDNYQALKAFFKKFPDLANNDLYLSGESYAGVYVPTLAYRIHQAKQQGDSISFKGFIVGNACTDPSQCYFADLYKVDMSRWQIQYLKKHAFISQKTWQQFRMNCILGFGSPNCKKVIDSISYNFNKLNVSINNIYAPCYQQLVGSSIDKNGKKLKQVTGGYISCDDILGGYKFLNELTTKTALHVTVGIKWNMCSDEVNSRFKKNQSQSLWWVYSGDVDANVPIIGTKRWVNMLREQLDIPDIRPWRQWWVMGKHQGQDQVAGDTWQLQGFTLVTVRGAGHFVPQVRGRASSVMINHFLKGTPLPFR